LPIAGAACRLEFPAQPFVVAPQSFDLPSQRIALALRAFRALANRVDLCALGCRIGRALIRHVDVMPDPPKKYKYGILDRPFNEASGEARTR